MNSCLTLPTAIAVAVVLFGSACMAQDSPSQPIYNDYQPAFQPDYQPNVPPSESPVYSTYTGSEPTQQNEQMASEGESTNPHLDTPWKVVGVVIGVLLLLTLLVLLIVISFYGCTMGC